MNWDFFSALILRDTLRDNDPPNKTLAIILLFVVVLPLCIISIVGYILLKCIINF